MEYDKSKNLDENIDANDSTYVNISSHLLRNKFERNRFAHMNKIKQELEESDQMKSLIENLDNSIHCHKVEVSNKIKTLYEDFHQKQENLDREINTNKCGLNLLTKRADEVELKTGNLTEGASKLNEKTISLTEDISGLEEKTTSLTEGIRELNEKTSSLTEDVSELNEKTSSLTEDVSELNEKTINLEANVSGLNEQTTSNNLRLDELDETLDVLNEKIAAIEKNSYVEKDNCNNDLMLLTLEKATSNNLRLDKVDKTINVLNEKMSSIEARPSNQDLILSTLENRITDIFNNVSRELDGFKKVIDFMFLNNKEIPANFNWNTYLMLNKDLMDECKTEHMAKLHYISFGKKEGRIYEFDNSSIQLKDIPSDFVWSKYLQMNIDLCKVITDKKTAELHYLTFGINERRLFKLSQLEKVNTFIYSGRKSGSSTLRLTMSNVKGFSAIQIHNNEDFIYKYGQCGYASIFDLVEHNLTKNDTIYIIDSYRTPIEKKISSFFQDIDVYVPNYKICEFETLESYFNNKYIYSKNCTHIYTEDYEPLDEMLEHFNLEKVTSFDFDKKYKIIKHKNIVFIKLRFYEIAKWNTLLSEIFKKQIEVKDENVSKTKSYYDVFKLFTESYKIPREYLTSLKTEKRFLTYNTKKEQKIYLKKWLAKSKD